MTTKSSPASPSAATSSSCRQLQQQNLESQLERVSESEPGAKGGFNTFELLYKPHEAWPALPEHEHASTGSSSSKKGDQGRRRVHMAILDSSFNPPTRAHRAIASGRYPAPATSASQKPTEPRNGDGDQAEAGEGGRTGGGYTARLLLLSPKNVDKTLKPGDASWTQRAEMMILLARSMGDNTAVGALNQPTFVGKSEVLRRCLPRVSDGDDIDNIHLTFLIGTDTLHRLFVERYYPSDATLGRDMTSQMRRFFTDHGSDVVVANRQDQRQGESKSATASREDEGYEGETHAREWIQQGKIRFVDIGKQEMEMSSTSVRKAVAAAAQRDGGDGSSNSGRTLEQMTDDAIREYIEAHGLYR